VSAAFTSTNPNYTNGLGSGSVTINKANTLSTVTSSLNPSVFGQSVTFTATVTAVVPGAGTPPGTVQFKIDGFDFGSPKTLTSGSATSDATTSLAVGARSITAVYLGSTNFNATGAGSSTASVLTQTVNAWYLTGFYPPVGVINSIHTAPGGALPTSPSVWNMIKGGQTVPLKFEIFTTMGGAERTSVSDVVQPFMLTPYNCVSGVASDDVDFTTTGGTSFRYDGPEGQFIQNWKTPTGAGKCYRATMTAIDGSRISAFFKTK
jgi:hypothetical protein